MNGLKRMIYIAYCCIFSVVAIYGALVEINTYKDISVKWLIILFLILVIITVSVKKIEQAYEKKKFILVVLILALVLRSGYYAYVGTKPISDFAQPTLFYQYLQKNGSYQNYTVNIKKLDKFQIYYSLYPAWGSYMLITHLIYSILGC